MLEPAAPLITDPEVVSSLTRTAIEKNLAAHSASGSEEDQEDRLAQRLQELLETREEEENETEAHGFESVSQHVYDQSFKWTAYRILLVLEARESRSVEGYTRHCHLRRHTSMYSFRGKESLVENTYMTTSEPDFLNVGLDVVSFSPGAFMTLSDHLFSFAGAFVLMLLNFTPVVYFETCSALVKSLGNK